MPLDLSALGSLTASLEDITVRLGRLAAECGEDDDAGTDLRDVERQLEASARRLAAVLRAASR